MGFLNGIEKKAKSGADAASEGVKGAARKTADTVAGGAKTVGKAVEDVAKSATSLAARKIATAEEAAASGEEVARMAIALGLKIVGSGFRDVETRGHTAAAAWEASTPEAKKVGDAIEAAGMPIGHGFVAGLEAARAALGNDPARRVPGLEALVKGFEENACEITVTSALSAALVALAGEGVEESAVGMIAVLAVANFVNGAALRTAAKTVASVVGPTIYNMPGVPVSRVIPKESDLESVISIVIVKACTQNRKLVIGTAGQFIAAVIIWTLTGLICEGALPGDIAVWDGVENRM